MTWKSLGNESVCIWWWEGGGGLGVKLSEGYTCIYFQPVLCDIDLIGKRVELHRFGGSFSWIDVFKVVPTIAFSFEVSSATPQCTYIY